MITLDDLNKELTRLNKLLKEGGEASHFRILAGKVEVKELENMTHGNEPHSFLFRKEGSRREQIFNIPIVWVDAESYFEVVYAGE
jgi:hypothetical protein